MGMSTEGGQLLLPPLSFIITGNSNIPPKVIVSDKGWGREISEMKKSIFSYKEEPKIRIFGGGGLLALFHHFGISQSLVLLKLTFSRHWHLSPSDVPLRTTPLLVFTNHSPAWCLDLSVPLISLKYPSPVWILLSSFQEPKLKKAKKKILLQQSLLSLNQSQAIS